MRVVVQRVSQARVEVDGEITGTIGTGMVLLCGFERGDGERELEFMAEKILHLRIFADSVQKMNLSVKDIKGEILSISQFTLVSDIQKGRRPDFTDAEEPEKARSLYRCFNERLSRDVTVAEGIFGARMNVHLVNDGPVTFYLEKKFPA